MCESPSAPVGVVLPTDRTVLPIPEPQYPYSTVLGARNAEPLHDGLCVEWQSIPLNFGH
jgi:hypothetical protein